MKIKAIVYDTNGGEPREITPRFVMLKDNGQPKNLVGPNGMRYREFHVWDDTKPCKYNDFEPWEPE
jgi:hypothetical protein